MEEDMQVCGPSYTTMAITNGIVCYSGTGIGSTAVYFCRECGYRRVNVENSLIRTCMESGQWNGSVPHCSCGGKFIIQHHACTHDEYAYMCRNTNKKYMHCTQCTMWTTNTKL